MSSIIITITAIQLSSAILLIGAILMQRRGTGLSGTFGGEGNTYSTRRGAEKIIFIATIILIVVFLASSVLRISVF